MHPKDKELGEQHAPAKQAPEAQEVLRVQGEPVGRFLMMEEAMEEEKEEDGFTIEMQASWVAAPE